MDRIRLEYAAELFLLVMRREFVRLNPEADPPPMTMKDFPPAHRSSLMKALGKAIESAQPGFDAEFRDWVINHQ